MGLKEKTMETTMVCWGFIAMLEILPLLNSLRLQGLGALHKP